MKKDWEHHFKSQINLQMQKIYEEYSEWINNKIAAKHNTGLIYHYTSAEGFYNIITNKKLFFTDVAFLNDSTETVNIITTYHKALKEIQGELDHEYFRRLKELITQCDFENMVFGGEDGIEFSRYFVLACSYQEDSLNLWNYYTRGKGNDWGYNIAFDEDELVNSIFQLNHENYSDQMELSYGRIIYNEQEKKNIICDFLVGLNQAWVLSEQEKDRANLLECIKITIKWLSIFFKHECFSMEEEYRMVVTLPYHNLTNYIVKREDKDELLYKTRFTNNMFTPYIKMRFQPGGIKGVSMSPLSEKYTTDYHFRNEFWSGTCLTGNKDVLQYGVHEFLRVNGYDIDRNRIKRSQIPLRF